MAEPKQSTVFHTSHTSTATGNVSDESWTLEASSEGQDVQWYPWNNPRNLMSYQTSRVVIDGVQLLVFPCILLVGVTTNALNCVVFYRQGVKDRMNLCLLWLSVMDMCYLLCQAVGAANSFVALFDPVYSREFKAKSMMYRSGMNYAFASTSSCISVVIALERCACVVFPLQAPTFFSSRAMVVFLLSLTAVLQLAFSVFPLTWRTVQVVDKATGEPQWIYEPKPSPHKEVFLRLYEILVTFILLFLLRIVNVSLVTICTVITVLKLRKASSWRKTATIKSTNASDVQLQKEETLKRMLVLISYVYILCSTSGVALALWRRADPRFDHGAEFSNTFIASHIVAYQVFAAANSAVNFVYYVRSSRFKHELRQFCRPRSCCW